MTHPPISVTSPHHPTPPSSPPLTHKRRRTEFTSTTPTSPPPCSEPSTKCHPTMHSNPPSHHPHPHPHRTTTSLTNIASSPSSTLRKAIRAVQKRSISDAEKQQRIHDLFAHYRLRAVAKDTVVAPLDHGRFPGEGASHGCEHYERKCWIRAKCCGRYYPCRRCHDEKEDHEIDRHATEQVACVQCGEEDQPVASNCRRCGVLFARYFCAVCKFYDDKEGKDAYHCQGCGICRVGKGLGIDNHHCDGCGSCVPIDAKDSHPCRDRSLDANCPICTHYLRTSTEPVVFMRCGHTMHVECLSRHTQSGYTCPLCHKCLTDMGEWYRALDERIARDVIPPEYAKRRSRVLCHDCDQKTVVPFHFVHHKCGNEDCGGYNTRVLEQFDVQDDADDSGGGDGGGGGGGVVVEGSRTVVVGTLVERLSGTGMNALENTSPRDEVPIVGGRS